MISMSAGVACGWITMSKDVLKDEWRATYFLQLEQLGGLHQVLQLQSSLWHAMRFAPFFYPGDIVLYLHRFKI